MREEFGCMVVTFIILLGCASSIFIGIWSPTGHAATGSHIGRIAGVTLACIIGIIIGVKSFIGSDQEKSEILVNVTVSLFIFGCSAGALTVLLGGFFGVIGMCIGYILNFFIRA